jgi:hypothetical protein
MRKSLKTWKEIWNSKLMNLGRDSDYSLSDLIRLSGYDSGSANFTEENWRLMF